MRTHLIACLFGLVAWGSGSTAFADNIVQGQIACAQERGEVLGKCSVRVDHSASGDVTARVTFPNGFERRLFFVGGAFTRGSATMSGAGTDTDWVLENGVHFIRVDDQRFEVPETLVSGQEQ